MKGELENGVGCSVSEVSTMKMWYFTDEVQRDANELIPGISMVLEVVQEGIVFSQWLRILEQDRHRNKECVSQYMSLFSLLQSSRQPCRRMRCVSVTYGSVSHEGSFLVPVGLRLSGVLPPALLLGCHRVLSYRFASVCLCVSVCVD